MAWQPRRRTVVPLRGNHELCDLKINRPARPVSHSASQYSPLRSAETAKVVLMSQVFYFGLKEGKISGSNFMLRELRSLLMDRQYLHGPI